MEKLRALFEKYREILLYLVFGGLTTLVNIAAYWALSRFTPLDVMAATGTAWFLSVVFAYLTNRTWVFQSRARGKRAIAWEALAFLGGRAFSGALDLFDMWLFVQVLGGPDLLVKIASNVLVILVNYVISKWIVFRKTK